VAHAQRRERVDDRVHHRGRHADVAGFAEPLGAERIARRRRVRVVDLGARHVIGTRDGVVHQRS